MWSPTTATANLLVLFSKMHKIIIYAYANRRTAVRSSSILANEWTNRIDRIKLLARATTKNLPKMNNTKAACAVLATETTIRRRKPACDTDALIGSIAASPYSSSSVRVFPRHGKTDYFHVLIRAIVRTGPRKVWWGREVTGDRCARVGKSMRKHVSSART